MRKIQIEFKWSIIFNIALLCWILLENTLAWHEDGIENFWWLSLIFSPFAILMYLLALRQKRRSVYYGEMTWSQGFRTGVILSFLIALISPLTQYIIHSFFTQEYFNTLLEFSITNNLLTHSKLNAFLNIDNYLWQASLGVLCLGIITSAVTAIFVRKE